MGSNINSNNINKSTPLPPTYIKEELFNCTINGIEVEAVILDIDGDIGASDIYPPGVCKLRVERAYELHKETQNIDYNQEACSWGMRVYENS